MLRSIKDKDGRRFLQFGMSPLWAVIRAVIVVLAIVMLFRGCVPATSPGDYTAQAGLK